MSGKSGPNRNGLFPWSATRLRGEEQLRGIFTTVITSVEFNKNNELFRCKPFTATSRDER